jgi:subtilase family serine protease
VATPGSPQFRHYLTVAEFAQRYGAGPEHIAAVSSALRAAGLTIGAPAANGLSLPVSGSTATVEHAFATSIASVALPGGRVAYANTVAPTLAPDVAGAVLDVLGLSNVTLAHAASRPSSRHSEWIRDRHGSKSTPSRTFAAPGHGLVVTDASGLASARARSRATATGGPSPCASASGAGGYTADTIASAYQFTSLYSAGDLGAGQTVAVYELQPYNPTDVSAYESCYAINPRVVPVPIDGGGTYTGGDDTEAALDIEQVAGLAPQATIRVYTAPNGGAGPYDAYSQIATDDVAKVLTSSWGLCESQVADHNYAYARAENSLFAEMALQGQGVMVASGDSGSAACDESDATNQALSVGDPASSPFATGVGGSTLYTSESGSLALWSPGRSLDEAVWNEDTPGGVADATGGGVSEVWGMPSYQSGAAAALGVVNADSSAATCAAAAPGSTSCRQVPDVSASADPNAGYAVYVTDSSGSQWTVIGGTSAAAPVWAALMALANAQASCAGKTIGFANPSLYALAGSNYAGYFRDISLANPRTGRADNDALQTNGGLYPVTPGYDMTTGLGAPLGAALAGALCARLAPVYTVSYAVPDQLSPRGHALSLATHATDSGKLGVSYSAGGLPPGLTIDSPTGTISGTPTRSGVFPVTLTARDDDGNSAVAKFNWTVVSVGRPQATGVTLTGVARQRLRLSFTMHSGAFAPSLASVSIALPRGLSLARRGRAVARGLTVKVGSADAGYNAAVSHGVLTIKLRQLTGSVFVAVAGPTLSASSSLIAQTRHRTVVVRVGLKAIDAARASTGLELSVRVGR